MSKKNIINLMLFIIISIPFISCQIDYEQKKKPNVIFILVDDLGWNDLTGEIPVEIGNLINLERLFFTLYTRFFE